jgi:hypothetical protein
MFFSPGARPRAKARNIIGSVLNRMLAATSANTMKANITGGSAAPTDATRASSRSNILYAPQITVITASGAGTYTTPTVNGELPIYLRIRMAGAGGGAGGSGTGGTNGNAGGNTTFGGVFTANGGNPGVNSPTDGVFPTGGAASGGSINQSGQDGGSFFNTGSSFFAAPGGNSFFSGAGQFMIHTNTNAAAANSAKANTGSGGAAGGTSAVVVYASGGASGAYCEGIITSPVSSYSYTNGAKGTGGNAGTSGTAGGNGADGIIIIEAYWQ